MAQIQTNDPLLTAVFRNHVVPNQARTKTEGRAIFDDIEVVDIYIAGRKTIGTFPAHDLEPTATRESMAKGGEPITYAMLYSDQYQAFKNNDSQPLSGTPLSEAPFLTEGKRRELKALKIHTVEALAALDGGPLKQLGMGGREWKDQAQAFLDSAAGTADVVSMAATIESLKQQLQGEREAREELARSIPVGGQQFAPQQGASQNNQEADHPPVDASTNFDDWTDDALKNFIAEKNGSRPKGNPNHATLVAAAIEFNKSE